MALSGDLSNYERWQEFDYFVQVGDADTGAVSESMSSPNSKRWRLKEVRLKFSSTFASVEDFVVEVSSILGSYFNQKIVSQALNGVINYYNQFDSAVPLSASDTLNFTFSMGSGTNIAGIQVFGWAVSG